MSADAGWHITLFCWLTWAYFFRWCLTIDVYRTFFPLFCFSFCFRGRMKLFRSRDLQRAHREKYRTYKQCDALHVARSRKWCDRVIYRCKHICQSYVVVVKFSSRFFELNGRSFQIKIRWPACWNLFFVKAFQEKGRADRKRLLTDQSR